MEAKGEGMKRRGKRMIQGKGKRGGEGGGGDRERDEEGGDVGWWTILLMKMATIKQ